MLMRRLPRGWLSLALAPVAVAQHQQLFSAPVLLDIPGEFQLAANVDNDGDVDVFAFEVLGIHSLVTPYRNDGLGNLTPGTPLIVPPESSPALKWADFDGDGFGDLLVTPRVGSGGTEVRVYPGLPGAQFGAPIVLPLVGNTTQSGVGQANGDGIADFWLHHFDGTNWVLQWFAGSASRTFVPGPSQPTSIGWIPDVCGFDADGDGDDDIAVLRSSFGGLPAIDLYRTNGLGLTAPTVFPLVMPQASMMVCFDVDGDLDRDLVVFGGGDLLTLENLGGGSFQFAAAHQFATSFTGRAYAGDVDGDGGLDLCVRSFTYSPPFPGQHGLTWLRRVGGWWTIVRTELVPSNGSSLGAGLVDLDGDGDGDLIDARGLRFGHSSLLQPPVTGSQLPRYVDWDGDGDLDKRFDGSYQLELGNGRGGYSAVVDHWPPNPGASLFFQGPVARGDFDGDGLQEALVPKRQQVNPYTSVFVAMHRFEANAADQMIDLGVLTTAQLPGGLPIDADGDGDLDLVNSTGICVQGPPGVFTQQPRDFQLYAARAAADVDADGDEDLLALTSAGGVAILRRTGPLAYAVDVIAQPQPFVSGGKGAIFADLDDDGDQDVLAWRPFATIGEVQALINQAGTFVAGAVFAVDGLPMAGDFDGDGRTDVAVQGDGTLSWWRRTGPGLVYAAPIRLVSFHMQQTADIDQDGDLDFLGTGSLACLRFDGVAAGSRRQYGAGGNGADGRRPLLAVVGPARPGTGATARLVRGVGGAPGVLFFGFAEANLPNLLPGLTAYIDGLVFAPGFVLAGVPGVAGAGTMQYPLPLPAGLTLFLQAVVLDAAGPIGLVHSNGVELTIGQ